MQNRTTKETKSYGISNILPSDYYPLFGKLYAIDLQNQCLCFVADGFVRYDEEQIAIDRNSNMKDLFHGKYRYTFRANINFVYNGKHFSEITFDGMGQLSFSGDFQPLYLPGETWHCYFTE